MDRAGIDVADRVLADFRDSLREIAERPAIGSFRPDLTLQSQRFRRVHSWYVVYRFDDRLVEVLRVIHASRDIRRILGEVE